MEESCFDQIEKKYDFIFKDKQRLAIKSVVTGHDTCVILPTGYGKTKIYVHLPEIYKILFNEHSSVLVISPLQALMVDQVKSLNGLGIKATFLGEMQKDKGVATCVSNGEFNIVYCSPEAALTPGLWRRCITKGTFQQRLRAVVIDEAHCITQWGDEFREDYSKLGELRSVVPKTAVFVSLTVTCTASMQKEIMKKLEMTSEKTQTISVLPERPNIAYYNVKSKRNMDELQWIVDDLKANGHTTKKTVIYCRNIVTCANLYKHFKLAIGEICESLEDRSLAMFHRSTAEPNKAHVLNEFPKADSNLRVVFATIAFGMGIDIPDIERIIHWGGPRGLEQYSQESGRAGRDGRLAVSIVYYNGYDIAKGSSTTEARDYCKSEKCLRKTLMRHFSLVGSQPDCAKPDRHCCCCSICALNCDCGDCINKEFLEYKMHQNLNVIDDNEDSDIKRILSYRQLELLRANVLDFKECLIEEHNELSNQFDDTLIDNIVEYSPYILCEEDLVSLEIVDVSLVSDILTLIEEV